ncbi:hypothetical protein JIN85_15290 [Luteolibacter pohnpeiensis]|uniref:PA14 domain-containing protein n=1 Tax=Luteolibacter pohnpeiensis TaxID=454153 RepID=A0A934S6X8_9BACT|nr:PA14 domain-containing protein [Luteolibacter pohnpeiensis]MBK1883781.1 hypothetical protein [Luteolibacter pohnpeiensis]
MSSLYAAVFYLNMILKKCFITACVGAILASVETSTAGEVGKLSRELWLGVSGTSTAGLYENPVLFEAPDTKDLVDSDSIPANLGDNYIQRLRGYLKPAVTGNYTFWISSDDYSELWLSTSESKFDRTKIAFLAGASNVDAWDDQASQMSITITLQAGQSYFLEVLHKEGAVSDHVELAWQIAGGTRELIPAANMESFTVDSNDLNENELPDDWETQFGLNTASSADQGALADPDHDGFSNYVEAGLGSDPLTHSRIPGVLTMETWNDIGGARVEDLTWNPRFSKKPDSIDYVTSAATPTDRAENFGSRLRGLITAPTTGDYTFYISGDDNCELWLSGNESQFSKVKIAGMYGSSNVEQWDKYVSQESLTVSLTAGESYYIEAILKESKFGDHMEIGWKTPGATSVSVIPGSSLSSYAYDLDDPDGDGMPTAWESAHGLDPMSAIGDDGAAGDPDQDGIQNLLEYEFNSDPFSINSIAGGMTREVWRNVTESDIDEFRSTSRYWGMVDDLSVFNGALSPVNDGSNFIARGRAWLTAPATGDYTFWIASDDDSELWLSPTSSKFGRVKIAYVSGATGQQNWDSNASQQSATVHLVEGESYFLEVLHKEGGGDDHFSIAWQIPGGSREVIPSSALNSYTFDPDDVDRDELSDTWEAVYGFSLTDNGTYYPDQHPAADPDGDGVPNYLESLANVSPFKWSREAGGLTLDTWDDLNGVAVSQLTQSERFPLYPDHSQLVTSARTPQNQGDNFASRMRGVVIPPVTGDYTFYLSSDDHGELWLSTNESQFSKQKIAWVDGASGVEQWDLYPTQMSTTITLQAGQKYYIEALTKESIGNDHMEIGWLIPGTSAVEVIDGQYLEGHCRDAEDPDGDELPTSWEQQYGFDPMSPASSLETNRDPDMDGIPNWLEYQNDTDPLSSGVISGALLREVWTNVQVDTLQQFVQSEAYYQAPQETSLLFGAEAQYDSGDDYVERLRGALIAPVTGDYTFWISSDDHGELWLSSNSSKFGRRKIASCIWTASGQNWDSQPYQKSETIHLEAGQHYFIEALHQDVSGGDHLEIAWQVPGSSRELIPSSALQTFLSDPNDQDHNELPDDWESTYGFTGMVGGEYSPLADPDGDGIPNWAEALAGGDPFHSGSISGFLSFERWNDMPYYSLHETVASEKFYGAPDETGVLSDGTTGIMAGEYFASRARGYIEVPVTGSYEFWIGANTSAELWLSTDHTKYAKQRIARLDSDIGSGHGINWADAGAPWDLFSFQRSEPIQLEAGQKYYIEVDHQRGHSILAHFSIGWARDGGDRTLVPSSALSTYVQEAEDADDDFLPDAWEVSTGLDPVDNGRLDLVHQGERGDFDEDGITNREEYLLGTNPCLKDTDGDGVSDYDELHTYGTSPTSSNLITETEVSAPTLTNYNAAGTTGVWQVIDGGLIGDSFRGTIEWNFTVPQDGWWFVEVAGRLRGNLRQSEDLDLGVQIDNATMAPQTMEFLNGQASALKVLTPYLQAGTHTFKLDIRNEIGRRTFQIQSLRVFDASGFDSDLNGRPDWLDTQLTTANTVENISSESYVSPLFVEGHARYRGATSISAATSSVIVNRGLGDLHWYANAPLESTGSTTIEILQEGETQSHGVSWERWNVLDGNSITIRLGDSLKLGGWIAEGDTGTVTLTLDGVTQTIDADSSYVHQFTSVGTYTVNAEHSSSVTGACVVNVVDADFGSPMAFYSDTPTWRSFPDVASSLSVDSEPSLLIDDAIAEGDGQRLYFRPLRSGTHVVAARIGSDGPIVALGTIPTVGVSDALRNDAAVYIGSTEDGYRVLRTPIVVTDIQPGWTVVITISRAGVTFLDGTTELTLTYEDFVNGVAYVDFRYPPDMEGGYCHYTDVYDEEGRNLGRR